MKDDVIKLDTRLYWAVWTVTPPNKKDVKSKDKKCIITARSKGANIGQTLHSIINSTYYIILDILISQNIDI